MLERSTPEAEGLSSEAVLGWLEEVKKLDSLHSFQLLRHRRVVAEGWWQPYNPETPHALFSLSKSFTSLAIGFARAEGKLRLSDRLIDYFPDLLPETLDPRFRSLELRHLLMMATGHRECALEAMCRAGDGNWAAGFFRTGLAYEPGSRFCYNSAATYMLSAVLQRAVGVGLVAYLGPRLLDPLGIRSRAWERCPRGIETGGWGYALTTCEIGRFAQLLLDGGRWEGRQLVPADYLAEATSRRIANDGTLDWGQGYGYQFWRSQHGAFRGDGAFGQFALVLPEQDAALAITAGLHNLQNVLNLVWERLLPAFGPAPLPPNPGAVARLERATAELALPLAGGEFRRGCDGRYQLAANPLGFRTAEFVFEPDGCRLALNGEFLRAGFGHRCDNRIRWEASEPRPAAASAGWTGASTLELEISFYSTPFNVRLVCEFDRDRLSLRRRSNLLFRSPEWPELIGWRSPETASAPER